MVARRKWKCCLMPAYRFTGKVMNTIESRTYYCQQIIDNNHNQLVPWYLMASYMYYHEDESLITDALYDEVCQRLSYLLDKIDHWHKDLIDPGALAAGTGYHLAKEDYPKRTIAACHHLLKKSEEQLHDTNRTTSD